MATLTTAQGYPYPASSETPDVPRDLAALANFLESKSQTRRVPGTATKVTANSAAISNVETTLVTSGTVTADGSTLVEVEFSCFWVGYTVATDTFDIRIKDNGTQIQAIRLGAGSGSGCYVGVVTTPTAGTHTYTVTMVRNAGTGTATVNAAATTPAELRISQFS